MSDEEQQAATAPEGEGQQAEQHTEQQAAQSPAIEDKARRMGWVPKSEFRGDPAKWRPADAFVERGENEMPILKERLRHQDKQLAELQATVKQFADYHTKTEQRAYDRAVKDLKARQIEAVSVGNTQAFMAIDQEIAQLQQEAASSPKIAVPDQNPDEHPVFRTWVARNQWYANDKDMHAYADSIGAYLNQANPTLVGDEFFAEVTKKVRAEFPDKFENPRRAAAAAVEGASQSPRKGGKGFSDLPPDAKAACDRFVKQGLIKSRDDFVKAYDWE